MATAKPNKPTHDKTYTFYELSSDPFSKFYPIKIIINNKEYLSVEHYYQCQKFITTDSNVSDTILKANTAKKAFLLGLKHENKIRNDWKQKCNECYYTAQKAKFQQHTQLKMLLLETKNKTIICMDNDDDIEIKEFGLLLTKIRDEFIKEQQNDDIKDDVKQKQQPHLIRCQSSKFKQTYSPIFAPFLVHVVVRLLNNSGQRSLDIHSYINKWGGGLNILRKCCSDNNINPDDINCSWDTLIDLCCISTPLIHNVWILLLEYNKIKITNNYVINLENLLLKWEKNCKYFKTFGCYPRALEQELYIHDTIPPEISQLLNYAIINDVFEEAFVAMEKIKKEKAQIDLNQPSTIISYFRDLIGDTIQDFLHNI